LSANGLAARRCDEDNCDMISRRRGTLKLRQEPAPEASVLLEREGYAVVEAVLSPAEVEALAAEITTVFDESEPDRGSDARNEFRHAMLNRSPLAQRAIAAPALLEVIEPLLGEDCHVIANTAWRNIAGHQGGPWHTDAGPHVPRPEAWPGRTISLIPCSRSGFTSSWRTVRRAPGRRPCSRDRTGPGAPSRQDSRRKRRYLTTVARPCC
jgi:hypothetical protein